jgi:hypothetical protein
MSADLCRFLSKNGSNAPGIAAFSLRSTISLSFVLSGPPTLFIAEQGPARPEGVPTTAPEQLDLF